MSKIPIELTIELEGVTEPTDKQTLLLEEFEANWTTTKAMIFKYIANRYKGTKWEKTEEELEQMYFLCSLDLKLENQDWWIVFEPEFNVPTIFNYFLRFTFKNNEISWSNIEL